MFWPGYSLVFLAPVLTFLSCFGGGIYYALPLMITFGVVPALDEIIGDDHINPSPEEIERLQKQKRYDWILYAFVPTQLALLLWGAYQISHYQVGLWDWLGLLALIGLINGGLSINIAHELGHRQSTWEQTLAKLLWFRVGYMHFQIEHVYGHHPRMGTPEDPATARFGESVYRFYGRCISGCFRSAWQIEKKRLERKGMSVFSWHNQMLWYISLPLIFAAVLYLSWGWQAALFYVLQCLLAIFSLETINYLEHYGLKRKRLPSGRYEPVGVQHSWNSSRMLSNYFLFKLQRHSDHHIHANRKYQLLRETPEGPQLPTGYGWIFLLALIPPLWHRVMDPRVKAYQQDWETRELALQNHDKATGKKTLESIQS